MKICHVSSFLPTQCGIATYVDDLISGIGIEPYLRVAIDYGHRTRPTADLFISNSESRQYAEVAMQVAARAPDIISLQHEFGMFGGSSGEYICKFIEATSVPVVVTLHTISLSLTEAEVRLVKRIADTCQHLVVLTERGRHALETCCGVDACKISVIRHGVPSIPFTLPSESPRRSQFPEGTLFVSAGHMRPAKGHLETIACLEELSRTSDAHFHFLIIGCVQEQFAYGKVFAETLAARIADSPIRERITWERRFLPPAEYYEYLAAADFGIVAYTQSSHNSSGVLPLFLSLGRPVIATKFEYAIETSQLMPDAIRSVEIGNSAEFTAALGASTQNGRLSQEHLRAIYDRAHEWNWTKIGARHLQVFRAAALSASANRHRTGG